MPTDWQPYQEMSNGSNPTEAHVARHLRSGLTHGRLDAMDEQELPAVELELHDGDPLQLASELTMANNRVAELDAENERLRDAIMPLETSSLAYVVQEAAAATMQRDQLQAALELERRAVEALAEHIETACEGFAHGGMSAMEVAPGGYTDATEIAAWARELALDAESGE